jgi:hypothetical protein
VKKATEEQASKTNETASAEDQDHSDMMAGLQVPEWIWEMGLGVGSRWADAEMRGAVCVSRG